MGIKVCIHEKEQKALMGVIDRSIIFIYRLEPMGVPSERVTFYSVQC